MSVKNFINEVLNDSRLFTAEDIARMSGDEFLQNEKAINYQMENLGIPRERDLIGNTDVVYVRAYTKDDGTKVKAHYRSKPDGINSNNSANQYRQSYRTNSTPTGAAADTTYISNSSNMLPLTDFSKFEKTNLAARFNASENAHRPHARELMNISLHGFKNMPEHPEFKVFQPEAVDYVNSSLDIKNSKELVIPKNWHGIIYEKESLFAKTLSNSTELQTQIMAKYDKSENKFTENRIILNFEKDKNFNYSIGHGTILNPRILEDGTFRGILFDKYDFDLKVKEYYPNWEITTVNNIMVGMQGTPWTKKYYVIIPISFKVRK